MQTNTLPLDDKKTSVLYQIVGFLFFGILVFMGVYFFKEREFLLDKTYYNFRIIRSGWFIADLGRYSDLLGMILPWITLKLGLSLKAIMICDSIGLVLLDYSIFLFVTLKLKNNGAGLAIILVSCLAYARVFYSTMIVMNDVLIFGVLLWAFIHPESPFTSAKQKRFATIGGLVAAIVLIFYHPLAVFLIFFVLGVETTASRRYRDPQIWIIGIVSVVLFYLKSYVLFVNAYDQNKMVPISTIIHELPNIKTWPSTQYLSDLVTYHFRSLKWLFIICVVFTLRKGIVFFLFTVLFITGFTVIFLGTFYNGASALFSYEAYFPFYGFFTAILFVCLFYHPSRKNFMLLILLPFLWIGLKKMYYGHEQFTYRISYMSRAVNEARKKGEKKCIIDSRCYPYVYADAPWAFSYETLLYSSLPGPDSTVTVFIKEPAFNSVCKDEQNKENVFFGAYFGLFQFHSNDMPGKYFHLPSTGYSDLTTSQDDTSFHANMFCFRNMKIVPSEQVVNVRLFDYVTVLDLKIENRSGKVLPAIPGSKNPIQLCYTMYDDKGHNLGVGTPTAFGTNIKSETPCGLTVYLPGKTGTYFVKPDIITGNADLWNVSSPLVKIVVN